MHHEGRKKLSVMLCLSFSPELTYLSTVSTVLSQIIPISLFVEGEGS